MKKPLLCLTIAALLFAATTADASFRHRSVVRVRMFGTPATFVSVNHGVGYGFGAGFGYANRVFLAPRVGYSCGVGMGSYGLGLGSYSLGMGTGCTCPQPAPIPAPVPVPPPQPLPPATVQADPQPVVATPAPTYVAPVAVAQSYGYSGFRRVGFASGYNRAFTFVNPVAVRRVRVVNVATPAVAVQKTVVKQKVRARRVRTVTKTRVR